MIHMIDKTLFQNMLPDELQTFIDFLKNILTDISSRSSMVTRHKELNALKKIRKKTVLSGKIQADELYKSINLKGTKPKNMLRFSKPRQTKGGSKRGISNHQACIASAIDEWDNTYFKIVGVGPINTEMIEKTFSTVIKLGSTLITNCKSLYEKFSYGHNLKLQQVKLGTYQNLDGYNLAEINGLHSNVKSFLQSFIDVSTKHLQGYLDWFSYQKYLTYTVEL